MLELALVMQSVGNLCRIRKCLKPLILQFVNRIVLKGKTM